MSRIGLQPITIKDGVQINIEKGGQYGNVTVTVKGPKGELTQDIRKGIKINEDKEAKQLNIERVNDSKQMRAYHGLYRSLVENMIVGVTEGYQKNLEIHGVGFRAKLTGKNLEINLGLTHPVIFETPEGIELEIEKEIDIKVKGIDKQLVGETAARIRALKEPEPYKGKGIRYEGEYVRRKVGKTAAK